MQSRKTQIQAVLKMCSEFFQNGSCTYSFKWQGGSEITSLVSLELQLVLAKIKLAKIKLAKIPLSCKKGISCNLSFWVVISYLRKKVSCTEDEQRWAECTQMAERKWGHVKVCSEQDLYILSVCYLLFWKYSLGT